ncbi:MAG: tetratricopeptide repeat protein [Sulfuricella denitrificans]|nr:tetratricopeptide repeat protein [Sulfuricella denitrificans]
MSLINQMLQELEQRKADTGTTAAQVRAVGSTRRSAYVSWGWGLLLLLAGAAGGIYWEVSKPVDKTSQQVQPPAKVSEPVASTPVPAPEPVEDNTPSVLQLAANLSFLPSTPPAEHEEKKPLPAATMPPKQEARSTPVVEKPQAGVTETKIKAVQTAPLSATDINKEIRQLNPQQRAENAYRQAYASLQQGRLGEAEESLRQALQYDPRHAAARQALAALLIESRLLGRAEQLLQQGLELQPGNVGYAMTLARIQVERNDVAAALSTLQRNAPAGENAEYHGFLAALLQRGDHHKEAIDHYLAALRSNPASGPWLIGLGISLQADGQSAKAAEIFRRARQGGGLSPELQAFAEQRLKQLQ